MKNLLRAIKSQFKTLEETPKRVFLKEEIKDDHIHDLWETNQYSTQVNSIFNIVKTAYLEKDDHVQQSKLVFLNSPKSRGFHIPCKDYNFSMVEWQLFQYKLYQILNANHYILNLKEHKSYKKGPWFEQKYRYYLKPSYKHQKEDRFNQMYGNVLLDLTIREEKLFQFQCLCNVYQDSKFQEPYSLDKFMSEIIMPFA